MKAARVVIRWQLFIFIVMHDLPKLPIEKQV